MICIRRLNEICPCKDCQERHLHCHGDCEQYKKWKAELEGITSESRKRKEIIDTDLHREVYKRRYPKQYIWKK